MTDTYYADKAGKWSPKTPTEMERMVTPPFPDCPGHHKFLNPSINICDKATMPFNSRMGD